MMMSINIKLIAVLVVLLIVGVFIWQSQNSSKVKSINSFEECAQAGYPVMESYPEQCKTPDGRTFTKQVAQEGWQEQTVDEIGLNFKYPKDLVFRKEIADDGGRIRTVGFFLTKGPENNPEYQLYGFYQQFKDATEQDLELAKTEMDQDTIKDATIDGYSGIEGLILGEKTRHITIVLKDGKNFSVSTTPPTSENKELTDKIIETFDFK